MKSKLIIIVFVLSLFSCGYTNTESVTCAKVDSKERITKSAGKSATSYYLVFTDKGVFKVDDQLFRGNFSSSDWYGEMHSGEEYSFKTGGYRISALSEYKTIISKPKQCDE